MSYQIRKWYSFTEETLANESGQAADGEVLRKAAIAVALHNPYAGRFSRDLSLLVEPSGKLGAQFGRRIVGLLGEAKAESVGKACIVGLEGEYEHGKALLTSAARRAPASMCRSPTRTRCMCARTTTP